MLKFSFEFGGRVQFDRAFTRLDLLLNDMRPTWPTVKRALYTIEEGQFKSEGAKGRSGKWKALSRDYKEWKDKHYGVEPILVRTGALRGAMTGQFTSDQVIVDEKDEFGFGTRLPYQGYVDAVRPIVDFGDADRNYMQKEIQKDLLRRMRDAKEISQILEIQ